MECITCIIKYCRKTLEKTEQKIYELACDQEILELHETEKKLEETKEELPETKTKLYETRRKLEETR